MEQTVLTPSCERVLACVSCGQTAILWPNEPVEAALYLHCPNCGADEFRPKVIGTHRVALLPLVDILMEPA